MLLFFSGLVGEEDNLSPSATGSISRNDLRDNLFPSKAYPPTSSSNVAVSKLYGNCASAPLKHDRTEAEDSQVIENLAEEAKTAAAENNLEAEAEGLDVIKECAAAEQYASEALEIDSHEDLRIEFNQYQTEKETRVIEVVAANDVYNADSNHQVSLDIVIEMETDMEKDGEVVIRRKNVVKRKKAVRGNKVSKRKKFEEFWKPPSWGLVCGLNAVSHVNEEEENTP